MRRKRQNYFSEAYVKRAESRETNPDYVRGGAFLLDIPFYRTHRRGFELAMGLRPTHWDENGG
jgi:hypothetical protein